MSKTASQIVRLARPRESETLARLSRQLVEHGLPWRWRPGRIHHSIRNPDTTVIVADVDSQIAGFALMSFQETSAHLSLLAVTEHHQRKGIARSLMHWLLESCRVAGIAGVSLEVRRHNVTAISFYEGLGFSRTGVRRGYYEGREDALCMTLALTHPDLEKQRPQ